ncbi:hypothetical protein [Deinococcus sp.]|uniref:hypothetical protein n=1 Tax=Deinococcus sp. TaxID=47478 RepID=UPI003CC68AC7
MIRRLLFSPGPSRLLALSLLLGVALGGGASGPATLLKSAPSRYDATMTALTTDATGAPILAWVEISPAGTQSIGHLHAARWNGGWTALGGTLNENVLHNAWQLSAVRGPDAQPWLGWAEDAGTAHVDSYLMSRWDGHAWSDPSRYAVRRNLSDAGKSRAFTVTASNVPYLTWTNIYYPGAFAQVVQPFYWQGRVWEQQTVPLNHSIGSAAFFPAAARSPDGTLYTAWLEGDVAHSNVYVAQLGPAQINAAQADQRWTYLGGALNVRPHTYTFAPQLAAGADGLVAAWLEDVGGIDNLFVKRWNGSGWTSLGTSLNINPKRLAERPNLALDERGYPLLTWVEGVDGLRRAYAKRWNGQAWTLLGGGPLNTDARHDARSASVTVDGEGRAVLAWCEQAGQRYRVMLRRFAR